MKTKVTTVVLLVVGMEQSVYDGPVLETTESSTLKVLKNGDELEPWVRVEFKADGSLMKTSWEQPQTITLTLCEREV